MRAAVLLALSTGCTLVYNSQYDDRKAELEQSRELFRVPADHTTGIAGGDHRIFWVDTEQTVEHAELHSIDMRDGSQVDYATQTPSSLDDFSFADDVFTNCVGEVAAYDATRSGSSYGEQDAEGPCTAVSGTVYYVQNDALIAWLPSGGSSATHTVYDFSQASPQISVGNTNGFAPVDATHVLFQEGNNLWLLDTTNHTPVLLSPPDVLVGGGTIIGDEAGAVYSSEAKGPVYVAYDGSAPVAVSDLIADGGYDLDYKFGDLQELGGADGYTIFDRHMIYTGKGGIFALGLDTGNVVDLLLNGRPDEYGQMDPLYANPTITEDGSLFVQQLADPSSDYQAVYRVDLSGRLK